MKKLLLASLLATPMLANADTFAGIYVGGQYWDMNASGSFGDNKTLTPFDLEDEGKGSVWLAVEHFVPLIPNLKLRHNQLDTDGSADVTGFEFGGVIYDGRADLSAGLDHTDIIVYYEILDNDIASFDIGFNLKYADYKVNVIGEVSTIGGSLIIEETDENYKGVIPLAYAYGEVNLPLTGLGVFADVSMIKYDGNRIYDYQVGAKYALMDNLAVDIDLQVGYRAMKIDIDDLSDLYFNTKFDGFFAGMQFHF